MASSKGRGRGRTRYHRKTSSAKKTRGVVKSGLFGAPSDLSDLQLPTYADVMSYYQWLRKDIDENTQIYLQPLDDVLQTVSAKVAEVWKKASVPVVSDRTIFFKVKNYYHKCRRYEKSLHREDGKEKAQRDEFVKDARATLYFDIAACKCRDIQNCDCVLERKVPHREVDFLLDQRKDRKMVIGEVDQKTSELLSKKHARKMEMEARLRKEPETEPSTSSGIRSRAKISATTLPDSSSSDSVQVESSTDSEFEPGPSNEPTSQRISLKHVASAAYRTGVSDRGLALIASSVLQDVGLVTETEKHLVIDRNKIRRHKDKLGKEVLDEENFEGRKLKSVYFDGRKDKSIKIERKGSKRYRREVDEEHISVLAEPGSAFVGMFTPPSGHGRVIGESLHEFLVQKKMDCSELTVAGCDGAPANTGKLNGAIATLEELLDRELQHIVCILHTNELPLRHLLSKLDGGTTGPKTFSGPIGSSLAGCEKLPVASFQPIPVSWISDMHRTEDLSTDQKYLFDICAAVSSGHCPKELQDRTPSPAVQSRWVTTACRLLRRYVSTTKPSDALAYLAQYVIRVYAPVWFGVRKQPGCADGPRHLWKIVELSAFLPDDLQKVINSVVQTNGFYAHPENLLVAMATDEDEDIRKLAWRRIKKCRTAPRKTGGRRVRMFQVPKLNFKATKYYDSINWAGTEITEPPITKSLPLQEIEENIKLGSKLDPSLACFPGHTQAVERAVKLVTEAVSKKSSAEDREAYFRVKTQSRKKMPAFSTKHEYVP